MAPVFLKLLSPKQVFTYTHKKSCFWKLFRSECVKESLKLLKSAEKYFYLAFSSVSVHLREKKSFSVWSEILGLLVNTLTPDYEYSLSNMDKLQLPVQMQLPEKLEAFSRFLLRFWNMH